MMQLWLLGIAVVLLWRSDVAGRNYRLRTGHLRPGYEAAVMQLAGWAVLAGTVVLTIAAGGTVG